MKNTLVRAFVFALVFSGFAASAASYRTTSHDSVIVMMAKGGNTSLPTPVCAPNDPNHCGMKDE